MADTHKLLLVEEDPLLAEITEFRLTLLGFEVRTVSTGAETLAALDAELPDAILLDVVLPDMEGYQLIERIGSNPATSAVPVMVFSTDSDLRSVQRAFAAGAVEYLVTPYDPAVLEGKLELLLDPVPLCQPTKA